MNSTRDRLLDAIVPSLAVGAVAAAVWLAMGDASGGQRPGVRIGALVEVGAAPVSGSPDANVAIFEFSDFECPFCSRWAREVGPEAKRQVLAKGVRWVFKHLPLVDLHPRALGLAQAADCAQQQGAFSVAYHTLFSDSRQSGGLLESLLPVPSFNSAAFERCRSGPVPAEVTSSIKTAERIGVNSTPTFVVAVRESSESYRITGAVVGAASATELLAAAGSMR